MALLVSRSSTTGQETGNAVEAAFEKTILAKRHGASTTQHFDGRDRFCHGRRRLEAEKENLGGCGSLGEAMAKLETLEREPKERTHSPIQGDSGECEKLQ